MRGKDRKLRKCVLDGVFIQYHHICVSSGTEIRLEKENIGVLSV